MAMPSDVWLVEAGIAAVAVFLIALGAFLWEVGSAWWNNRKNKP